MWSNPSERYQIKQSVQAIRDRLRRHVEETPQYISTSKYASTYMQQLYLITLRNFQQDWRTPSYLCSKFFLTLDAVSVPLSMT